MSGIYGISCAAGVDPAGLAAMSAAISHRGSIDRLVCERPGIAMGIRASHSTDRAAGTDASAMRGPGGIHVALDGTVFNGDALRRMLTLPDGQSGALTDSDLIAWLYDRYGIEGFARLRGLFAVAIWDERRGRLVLLRDHIGHKSLYYDTTARQMNFASEVKALLAARPDAREVDVESLHHYLSLRFLPAPRTMLRNIAKLPPGTALAYENGELTQSRYWKLSFSRKLHGNGDELIAGLRDRIADSVKSHCAGGDAVGAFLSGGLDSSLVVALMTRARAGPVRTFTIGSDRREFDERRFARLVATTFGSIPQEAVARTDLFLWLPQIVWYLDEPSDPVAASKFLASRLAASSVRAVLGGDGGDELFAGFDRYAGIAMIDRMGTFAGPLALTVKAISARLPATFGYQSLVQNLRWVARIAAVRGTARRYGEAVSFFRFSHSDKQSLFAPEAWQTLRAVRSEALLEDVYRECDAENTVERMLQTEYLTRLPEHSLFLTDRMGAAHGVEVRSPLADHELVSYCAQLPARIKVHRMRPKHLARQVARTELPGTIVSRRKAGFRFPLASWFAGSLRGLMQRMIAESRWVASGHFSGEAMQRLLEEHCQRRRDNNVRLWMLLNLEIWHRLVIDRMSHESVAGWMRDAAPGFRASRTTL